MSKPAFSRKRKGKKVDPYPLGGKSIGKTTRTKGTRGRPRKPKAEKEKKIPGANPYGTITPKMQDFYDRWEAEEFGYKRMEVLNELTDYAEALKEKWDNHHWKGKGPDLTPSEESDNFQARHIANALWAEDHKDMLYKQRKWITTGPAGEGYWEDCETIKEMRSWREIPSELGPTQILIRDKQNLFSDFALLNTYKVTQERIDKEIVRGIVGTYLDEMHDGGMVFETLEELKGEGGTQRAYQKEMVNWAQYGMLEDFPEYVAEDLDIPFEEVQLTEAGLKKLKAEMRKYARREWKDWTG